MYERITRGDLSHDDDCRGDDWEMECETSDASSATAEEWARLKEVKALFPDAIECAIKRHSCNCNACEESIERSGIYVKLHTGAFTFNREFGL